MVSDLRSLVEKIDGGFGEDDLDENSLLTLFGKEQDEFLRDVESVCPSDLSKPESPPEWLQVLILVSRAPKIPALLHLYPTARALCALLRTKAIATVSQACEALRITVEHLKLLESLMMWILFSANNTCIFRTVAGRIGFCPSCLWPGDNICFIPGGERFHALSEDCRTHVSALVTIGGLMGEELLNILPEDKTGWVEFHLR